MATANSKCGENITNDGVDTVLRTSRLGELVVANGMGRFAEATRRARRFMASSAIANAAPGQQSIAFVQGTTVNSFLTLCLSNPVGSNTIAFLDMISWNFPVIPTTVNSTFLLTGFNSTTNVTHTTPAIINKNCLIGSSAAATCKADNAFSLPTTPDISLCLTSHPSAITIEASGFLNLEGSIALLPGAYAVINTLAASAAAGFLSTIWWTEAAL